MYKWKQDPVIDLLRIYTKKKKKRKEKKRKELLGNELNN
jgi:hypothetical protein